MLILTLPTESSILGRPAIEVHRPASSPTSHWTPPAFLRRPCVRSGFEPGLQCGEVEDVVRALTPVGRGVPQVFHDLLVELRLLLVAEVEEGKEEEGQEESEEVTGGSRDNNHMDGHDDGREWSADKAPHLLHLQ